MRSDFARQGLEVDKSTVWRVTTVNENYQICDTYPQYLVVPSYITDDQIRGCAQFRSKGRIPVLTWVHPSGYNGGCIVRCSQPLVGVMRSRSYEDESVIDAFGKATKSQRVHIIDCRPKANAIAQRVMGKGYEDTNCYPSTTLEFMGIDNIHAMNSSLNTLMKLCQKPGDVYWLSSLEGTGWLRHSRLILQCAKRVVELVEQRVAVVIHCSDGWDRTSQISALAQLLLDPHYRTIEGFEELIEKEWCSFGHKFCDRVGHLRNPSLVDEVSPVFMQFIDCVWQILQQFPTYFEFNELFLVTILDHLHSCLFGNFLHNSEKEREQDRVKETTISLWTYIHSERYRYENTLYSVASERKVLLPDCDIETLSVHFWIGYFYRYRMGMKAKYQLLLSKALNSYQMENNQMKQTLEVEKSQRKELQKKLQLYKDTLLHWKKYLEQSGVPHHTILSSCDENSSIMDGNDPCTDNDLHCMTASEDDDDVEEQATLSKSVQFMENYF